MLHNRTEACIEDEATHILVVDDDRRIRELLKTYLQDNGFRVSTAGTAIEAGERMRGLAFDLLILDVMMPGQSGLEFARELRRDNTVPILMLTARAEVENRIEGLESGVDDYLPKPFEPRELLLRIQSVLRRQAPVAKAVSQVSLGHCTFHVERGELKRGDETIRLTTRERELMRQFARQPGKPISRGDLGNEGANGGARAIDVQINRLRRKIEADPATPVYLQTVRGAGYILYTD
jgi:two-component system phosphate regulon response regulator OmpR